MVPKELLMYNFCFDCYVLVVKGNEKDNNAQRKACVRNFKPWVPTVAEKGDGGDHSTTIWTLFISISLGFGVQVYPLWISKTKLI